MKPGIPRPSQGSARGIPKSGGIPRPSSSLKPPSEVPGRPSTASSIRSQLGKPAASSTMLGKTGKLPSKTPKTGTKIVRPGPSRLAQPTASEASVLLTTPRPPPSQKKTASNASRIEIKTTKVVPKMPKFQMPTMSTMIKGPRKPLIDREAAKKKMFRRQAPEGEDVKKLREIIQGLKGQEVTVQEYVGLIAPYTGDQGEILRTVMAEDINSFRHMARKIYETMTQDVSDVLTNEHVQLISTQNEKFEMYSAKMMRAIEEIFDLCPDFSFESYYQNPGEYLLEKFPLAKEVEVDPEEEELRLRQEAFHRLQWLRSEGDRLNEENVRLQTRLHDLKKNQRQQLQRAAEAERNVEEKRAQLEAAEANLQDKLEDLNESIDKSMVAQESSIRKKLDTLTPPKKPRVKGADFSIPKREAWSKEAAVEIEEIATSTALETEVSKVSVQSKSSRMSQTKKRTSIKSKIKRPPAPPSRERSPFHFSPIKTPPKTGGGGKAASPFHFSPPKTPPGFYQTQTPAATSRQRMSPPRMPPPRTSQPRPTSSRAPPPRAETSRAASPPQMQTTRIEKTTTVTEPQAPKVLPKPRRSMAPRDSWGGYY